MSKKPRQKPVDTDQFKQFWAAYPRKEAKGKARASFESAMQIASFEEIMGGLLKQLPILRSREHQYIPHPTTWLNQERWEDELQPNRMSNSKQGTLAHAANEYNTLFGDQHAPARFPSLLEH